ncbi:MAG: geranylgeranyl reductase family protein [Acidimicrobiia bacterium]
MATSGPDLLIVGAGPAGIAAALEAQRLGKQPLVVDKASFPRDKICGDGLTTGALRLLESVGLDVRSLPSYEPVDETVLVTPRGDDIVLPLPTGPDAGLHSAVVRRVELDAALVDLARDRGIEFREGVEVTGARSEGARAEVTFADGSMVETSWVIAADGHWSPVRRMLREQAGEATTPELGTWHAFRQYFSGVDDRRLWVIFDADLLPGYAWVFPVAGGGANVGFGLLRGGPAPTDGKSLARIWEGLADRPGVRRALGPHAQPEGRRQAWPIPADYSRERLVHGRVLFAGDSANVVDPMTGEGIAQALETGVLAARAIATQSAGNVSVTYRDSVDRTLGSDLRFAALLQRVLANPLGARAALAAAGATPWTRRNFARWMFEDYPRALLFTPTRWRRGMFTPPGAYLPASRPLG